MNRLLRINAVCDQVGLSVSRVYQLMAQGRFPTPATIDSAKRWSEEEVQTWIAERLAARGASPVAQGEVHAD